MQNLAEVIRPMIFPDYGYIKNDPRYPSCRGNVNHHAEGISQGWGYRYMNPYIGDCDDTKNNCYPNKGFFLKSGIPTIKGKHLCGDIMKN